MTTLYVVPAEGEAFEHEFEGDALVIGRSSRCDLAVADRCLSRQHVRLFKSDQGWLVEDMGSRNGTHLNGNLISGPTPIVPGDVIDASMSRITFGGVGAAGRVQQRDFTDSRTIFRDASEIISESKRDFARPAESGIEDLRVLGDRLRSGLKSGVGVLGAMMDGKITFLCVVTDDMIQERDLKAGEIVKQVASIAGGSGGGRPHLALAGGKDISRFQEALEQVPGILEKILARSKGNS